MIGAKYSLKSGHRFDGEMRNRIGRETRSPVPTISARLRMGFKGCFGYNGESTTRMKFKEVRRCKLSPRFLGLFLL